MAKIIALLRPEQGSIAVLAAIAMTALLSVTALVTDVGLLYLNRAQLASAADAAALAGVQDLPDDTAAAQASALEFAAANGKNGDTVTVGFADDNNKIIVTATRKVNLIFAKIFGLSSSEVSAAAAAAIQPLSAATGVVPFGIVWQDFQYGQSYSLKEGGGSGYAGNYGALALGGSGASNYRNNIKYGYNSKLKIGDWVTTEPGNMSGPTEDGVKYRINLDPDAAFGAAAASSPRVVIVPVIESLAVKGRSDVKVVGFAAFFLEGVGGRGNDNYVTGKFIRMYMPGETSSSAGYYGLVGGALVE